MANKITREMIKELMVPTKKVVLTAKNGMEFEVVIKKEVTAKMKQTMLTKMMESVEKQGEEYGMIIAAIGLLQTLTDIEFGETFEEELEVLYWLEDMELSEILTDSIPKDAINTLNEYMETVLGMVKNMGMK